MAPSDWQADIIANALDRILGLVGELGALLRLPALVARPPAETESTEMCVIEMRGKVVQHGEQITVVVDESKRTILTSERLDAGSIHSVVEGEDLHVRISLEKMAGVEQVTSPGTSSE